MPKPPEPSKPASGASESMHLTRNEVVDVAWNTLAWLAVGIPLIWGISITLQKAAVLFK